MKTLSPKNDHILLYALQALAKGFSVFYFVLLPVFYADGLLTARGVGYIGTLFIVLLILGAVVVARWLHTLSTRSLMVLSSLISICATSFLFLGVLQSSLAVLIGSFGLMGLAVGIAMSGINALAAKLTTRGDRYGSLAKLGMLTDIVRILFPLLVTGAVLVGATSGAVLLIVAASLLFFHLSRKVPTEPDEKKLPHSDAEESINIKKNRIFGLVLSLEFLDSFSSSQLFVFLPLLFLIKGYSLENSLLLQSFIFTGYLCGRWLIGYLAKKYTAPQAITLAEIGMVLSIVSLLSSDSLPTLYVLSFTLGVCARGTSPAIKALAFDSLRDKQMRKGSALHVIAGDSGSALGQLLFGLLIAWKGVSTPFIVSAAVALFIAGTCIVFSRQLKDIASSKTPSL